MEIPVAKRPSENNTDKQKPQEEKKEDSPQKGMPHPREDIKQDTKPADTQEQVESSAKDNPTLDTNKSNSEAKPTAEEKTDAQPDAPKSSTKKRERRKITMKPAQVEEESEMGFDNAEKFAKSEEDSSEADMDMAEPEIQAPSEEEIQMEAEKEEHDEKVANLDNLAKSMPSMPHTDN